MRKRSGGGACAHACRIALLVALLSALPALGRADAGYEEEGTPVTDGWLGAASAAACGGLIRWSNSIGWSNGGLGAATVAVCALAMVLGAGE